jgi:hypothetical protein
VGGFKSFLRLVLVPCTPAELESGLKALT